ncbi:hypothetical protein K437DRAFT_258100 [Tilletiaria anomala UBC 951]|uniref:2-methoxy-6-polyprenyl-1,4-benzoquinol methylase, mitochondrial n=1 Tax=Tilletiaria anomala (strain ATCC 24038 / CBS 436.72 / UBC 951) TaxID=1037660 RepID=A0A066VJJ5_TILAU|nr:uncharacterized protein K437DRAFT_258100 [Tilletiaria anomala UBC 951]KDN41877.1 hypothetical protein K437DRAFT_258100 [Tilletiaria anomala UBC 951]
MARPSPSTSSTMRLLLRLNARSEAVLRWPSAAPPCRHLYCSASRRDSSSCTPNVDASSVSSTPSPSAAHRSPAPAAAAGGPASSSSAASGGLGGAADPTTHFGFRTIPESTKETLVGGVFSSVASSYDLMNDAMSLGIHRLWKDAFVSRILDPRGGISVLDVAGGTGDIAMRILDHARNTYGDRTINVKVLDINENMLNEGMKRLRKTMYWGTPQISFALGNAESLHTPMTPTSNPPRSAPSNPSQLSATAGAARLPALTSSPIPDNSLDLYTIAFGIRNCTHIDRVLQEAHRVLKPGGVFACLEFGKVGIPLLAELYRLYSFTFIPSMGHVLAGDRDSYQYLIESIERFPSQADFARMIRTAGFALPGSPAARSLGWEPFASPDASALGQLGQLGLGLASNLPGLGSVIRSQQQAMEEQRARNLDVEGAWEDFTFGVASVWTGVKV